MISMSKIEDQVIYLCMLGNWIVLFVIYCVYLWCKRHIWLQNILSNVLQLCTIICGFNCTILLKCSYIQNTILRIIDSSAFRVASPVCGVLLLVTLDDQCLIRIPHTHTPPQKYMHAATCACVCAHKRKRTGPEITRASFHWVIRKIRGIAVIIAGIASSFKDQNNRVSPASVRSQWAD